MGMQVWGHVCTYLLLQLGMRKSSGAHSRFGLACSAAPWKRLLEFRALSTQPAARRKQMVHDS